MAAADFLIGRIDDGLLIRVVGHGTMHVCPALRALVEASPAGRVVFDAGQCDYVDSTFLGCLVGIKKVCDKDTQRHLTIAASPDRRERLFGPTSLANYFDFVEVCPDAVSDVVKLEVVGVAARDLGRCVMQCHELLADMGGSAAPAFRAVADRLAVELGERPSAATRTANADAETVY